MAIAFEKILKIKFFQVEFISGYSFQWWLFARVTKIT